jgi:hypothetical protein
MSDVYKNKYLFVFAVAITIGFITYGVNNYYLAHYEKETVEVPESKYESISLDLNYDEDDLTD